MKKFLFKLEPLFEYRNRLEEISRKDFAEALKGLMRRMKSSRRSGGFTRGRRKRQTGSRKTASTLRSSACITPT